MKNGVHFEKTDDGFGGIYLVYQAGGIYERTGYRGISHLAEHIKCKKEKEFKRELNTLCLETNAVTDDGYVIFYCRGLEENVAEFADKYLSCFSFEPTEQEFEAEKLIVRQEIESMLNDYTLSVAYERGMFGYGGAAGFLEDITAITYKDFMKFYREMLGTPSSVVFVGGENLLKSFLKNNNIKCRKTARKPFLKEMNKEPDTSLYQVWSSKSTASAILFCETSIKSKTACQFLANLLSDGLYSPLYQEIRENNNLVYYISFRTIKHSKRNVFEFMTETSKFPLVKDLFFQILGNFEKYISREDYEDYLKKMKTVIRQTEMKKNSVGYVAIKYMSKEKDSLFHTFDPENPEFSYENMKKICQEISNRGDWKSMVHFKKTITFSDKV